MADLRYTIAATPTGANRLWKKHTDKWPFSVNSEAESLRGKPKSKAIPLWFCSRCSVVVITICFAWAMTIPCELSAQSETNNQRVRVNAKTNSPLNVLGKLHRRVTEKITGIGRNSNDESLQVQLPQAPKQIEYSQPQSQNGNGGRGQISYDNQHVAPRQTRQTQYQELVEHRTNRPHGAEPQHYREPERQYIHPAPNRNHATSRNTEPFQGEMLHQNQYSPRPQYQTEYQDWHDAPAIPSSSAGLPNAALSTPQQLQQSNLPSRYQYQDVPLANRRAGPLNAASSEYQTGRFQNGMGITQKQFDQQETATQRALRLKSENQLLISSRESLKADNQRLAKLVRENQRLLNEIESAISSARDELNIARDSNALLQKRVAQLESDKQHLTLESARQMDSIRTKLDDVLMREITSK